MAALSSILEKKKEKNKNKKARRQEKKRKGNGEVGQENTINANIQQVIQRVDFAKTEGEVEYENQHTTQCDDDDDKANSPSIDCNIGSSNSLGPGTGENDLVDIAEVATGRRNRMDGGNRVRSTLCRGNKSETRVLVACPLRWSHASVRITLIRVIIAAFVTGRPDKDGVLDVVRKGVGTQRILKLDFGGTERLNFWRIGIIYGITNPNRVE